MPPFDHPMVIAGQGTLALELLQQGRPSRPRICASRRRRSGGGRGGTDQTTDAANQSDCRGSGRPACLKAALDAGHPVDLPRVGLFAEGVAVKRIGDETFRLCQEYST